MSASEEVWAHVKGFFCRSPLWWFSAGLYLALCIGLIVSFGWLYGVALSLIAGTAALGSYWKVRG